MVKGLAVGEAHRIKYSYKLSTKSIIRSPLEEFILHLHALYLFLLNLFLFLLLLLALNYFSVLTQEPLLTRDLDLQLLLLFLLITAVLEIEFLLPSKEVFDSNWREGGKLRPFKNLHFLHDDLLLLLKGLALNQVLMDPVARLLDDIEDDWFLMAVVDDVINFLGDVI